MDINITLRPEVLFTIGDFAVTNSMFSMFFVVGFILLLFAFVAFRKQAIPSAIQLFVETFLTTAYDFVQSITGNERLTRRLYPLFLAMVTTFLVANLMGLLPFWGALSYKEVSIWRPPTADYSFVLGLALLMFVLWQGAALVSSGVLGYIKKYLNFTNPVNFFLGLLDIVGELAKIISISFRLFGNIFAGEAIAVVITSLLPLFGPIPFTALGILSSVVQAVVFPILVLLFMQMSIASSDESSSSKGEGSSEDVKASQKQQDQSSASAGGGTPANSTNS